MTDWGDVDKTQRGTWKQVRETKHRDMTKRNRHKEREGHRESETWREGERHRGLQTKN